MTDKANDNSPKDTSRIAHAKEQAAALVEILQNRSRSKNRREQQDFESQATSIVVKNLPNLDDILIYGHRVTSAVTSFMAATALDHINDAVNRSTRFRIAMLAYDEPVLREQAYPLVIEHLGVLPNHLGQKPMVLQHLIEDAAEGSDRQKNLLLRWSASIDEIPRNVRVGAVRLTTESVSPQLRDVARTKLKELVRLVT